MKSKIFIVSVIFLILGCSNQKINYIDKGKDILKTNTMDKAELLKSIEFFRLELKTNPNSIEALKNIAIAYGKISDHDKSIVELNKAINQNNKSAAELFYLRGMTYFNTKNYEKSISDYETALKYNPNNQKIYRLLFTSKLWEKYNENGEWKTFERSDVQNLIDEVYAESSLKPTYEELIDVTKIWVEWIEQVYKSYKIGNELNFKESKRYL